MSQVILITGCSRGLGKLLAEALASKGFVVYTGVRKQGSTGEQKVASF